MGKLDDVIQFHLTFAVNVILNPDVGTIDNYSSNVMS